MQITSEQVALTQLTAAGQSAKTSLRGFEAVLVTITGGTTYTYLVQVYDDILAAWVTIQTNTQAAQLSLFVPLYGARNFRINLTVDTTITSIDATAIERKLVA